jgi:hypothetical protein
MQEMQRHVFGDDLLELDIHLPAQLGIGLKRGTLQQVIHRRVGVMRGVREWHAGTDVRGDVGPMHADDGIAPVEDAFDASVMGPVQSMANFQMIAPSKLSTSRA